LQQLRRLRGRLATPKPKAAAAPPATAAFATGLGGLVAGLAGQALLQPAGRGRGRGRGGALTTAVAQPIAPPGLNGGPGSESQPSLGPLATLIMSAAAVPDGALPGIWELEEPCAMLGRPLAAWRRPRPSLELWLGRPCLVLCRPFFGRTMTSGIIMNTQ
jgi:hypothetical protein